MRLATKIRRVNNKQGDADGEEEALLAGPPPLLTLLEQLLTQGLIHVSVARAALLPVLGALSQLTSSFNNYKSLAFELSRVGTPYIKMLARVLILDECVLRDGSHAVGDRRLVPVDEGSSADVDSYPSSEYIDTLKALNTATRAVGFGFDASVTVNKEQKNASYAAAKQ